MTYLSRVALGFVLLAASTPATAQTWQLGTGLSGSYTNAMGFSGAETAQGFTSQHSFVLTGAKVFTIWYADGSPTENQGFGGYFAWSLYAGVGGAPGSVLASGLVIPDAGSRDDDDPDRAYDTWSFDLPGLQINKGQQYWFSVRNTDATGAYIQRNMYWKHASTMEFNVFPASQTRVGNGPWIENGATDDPTWGYGNRASLDLYGYVVPEPATILLAGVGLLGVLGASRLRRTQSRTRTNS